MLDIARHGGDKKPVSLTLVAERTGISRGYLEQLASMLRNNRLLRAISGRYGGYRLTRQAPKITIFQIVEAVLGPICVVDCIDDPESCPRSEFCECRMVYTLINNRIAEVLKEYTLADLLDPGWVRNHRDILADPQVYDEQTKAH
jgi:Rrf2 family protein